MIKRFSFLAWVICIATISCAAQDAPQVGTAAGIKTVLRSELPPLPALRERGERFEKSIRVTIYGDVRRPGVYYLPEGTVIGEGLLAARGTSSFFSRLGQSTLVRMVDEKHAQIVKLQSGKTEPEQMPLKDGDRLRLLHGEVY